MRKPSSSPECEGEMLLYEPLAGVLSIGFIAYRAWSTR